MNSILFVTVTVASFAITALLGRWLIPELHKLKFGQTIRASRAPPPWAASCSSWASPWP